MRILILSTGWTGGTIGFCARAFRELGHEVEILTTISADEWAKKKLFTSYARAIRPVDKWLKRTHWEQWNTQVKHRVLQFKPDILFSLNESKLYPETLQYVREGLECVPVCWLADDPFDSIRFTTMPVLLRHFTHIFVGEPMWIPHVRMVARPKTLAVLHGAADTSIFHPVDVTEKEKELLGAPVSFTGNAYGGAPEGLYRGAILEAAVPFGLKLWGYGGWERYFRYFPTLRQAYQGRGTSLQETNIINQVSGVVLNITHPQTFTAMQMRTFEIAASGGFQLADRRTEIDKLFPNGEIVQFSTSDELREKVRYYLDHVEERRQLAARGRDRVLKEHTYRHRMQSMLELVN